MPDPINDPAASTDADAGAGTLPDPATPAGTVAATPNPGAAADTATNGLGKEVFAHTATPDPGATATDDAAATEDAELGATTGADLSTAATADAGASAAAVAAASVDHGTSVNQGASVGADTSATDDAGPGAATDPDPAAAAHAVPGPPARPRVIAVANQKGGVGKTTTVVNLGTALAACGKRVLVVDLDPQGNASTGLGIDSRARRRGTYEALTGDGRLEDLSQPTAVPGLHLVAAGIDLIGAELELVDVEAREYRLRNALDAVPSGLYDYVLIDCPPALGLLTLNALAAADAVLVPLQCEFYALEGLSNLIRTIERIKRHFNPKLMIQGVVLTMYDSRNNLANMVADDVRQHFGDMVYRTVIPRNVRISEAPSHGKPVLLYDMKCRGAQAYIHLAGEVLRREQRARP